MALRVLLADESVTIKKVFQVALQDFRVEVTSVTIGSDVVTVAEKIQPDIVFVDVLLQKKNGYDVCRDLKNSPVLTTTPVVLVWSGFMELDKQKYQSSGANDHLEKPFDAQRLRGIVTKLVPKTQSQPVAPFLTMPKLPDFAEPKNIVEPPKDQNWSMESFDPPPVIMPESPDEFTSVSLSGRGSNRRTVRPPVIPTPTPTVSLQDEIEDDGMWVQKPIAHAQTSPPEPSPSLDNDDSNLVELNLDPDEIATSAPSSGTRAPLGSTLSENEIVEIVRAQSQEVIERVVWQVLPEIATRIVERELARLLEQRGLDREP